MKGLHDLEKLPSFVKAGIEEEYGSLDALYRKLIDLVAKKHALTNSNDSRIDEINITISDIEEELLELGVLNSSELSSSIASDYKMIFLTKNLDQLNTGIKKKGINLEEMKKWLERSHQIHVDL